MTGAHAPAGLGGTRGRLVTTPGLFVLAIRSGALSIDAADEAKAILEQHRFRMSFKSFRDVL